MSKKNNDNNETIQMMEISEGFIRWLMMNRLGKIYDEESLINALKQDLNDYFNLNCYDVLMGYAKEKDIYSKMENGEIVFEYGLISILVKCSPLKILVQSKGVILESEKENYILLLSIDNVFIR